MMLKDENIKLQNPQIRRKAMKHIIVHKPHQTRCNFGLFCNTKNYKMSWFDLDSFCDSWPKDFTYFGKKKKKITKSGSSSISGCPQRSRDLDNSPSNPPALRDDSTIDVLQPLTLSQLSGREASGIEGNYMFSPVWKSSTVSVLPLSDTWTAEKRDSGLTRESPVCLEPRWPSVSESTASLKCSLLKCHRLQKTRPEDWKQKQLREMTNLYEGGLFYL